MFGCKTDVRFHQNFCFQEMIENFEETEERTCVLEITKCSQNIHFIPWDNRKDTFSPTVVANTLLTSHNSIRTDSTSEETFHRVTDHSDSVFFSSTDPSSENFRANGGTEPPDTKENNSITTGVYNSTAFVSDYTTMERFHNITKIQGSYDGSSNSVPLKTGQDYIRQVLSQSNKQQTERSYQ